MSAAEQLESLISSVEADLGIVANAPVVDDSKQQQQQQQTEQTEQQQTEQTEQQQTEQKEQSKRTKRAKTPTTAKTSTVASTQPEITKLDIRVGHIKNVWKHGTADKLYCEEIDVGEDAPRAIASGLVPHYALGEMQDRRVLVLCNLKPRNLVGFRSHGMVLCAAVPQADGTEKVVFVTPPEGANVGERISFPGLSGEPLSPAQVEKKKVLSVLGDDMKTDEKGVAKWLEHEFTTSAGPCTALVHNGVIR